jgi:16S rRNA processing protein RimM
LSEAGSELDPRSAVSVGRIAGPHGIRGEIKVQPLTDFPSRFRRGNRVWLDGSPRRIDQSRAQDRLVVLKLDGIDTRTEAEQLRGKELMVPEAEDLEGSDRFYLHDIVGLPVQDESGAELGKIEDVLTTGANDVYVVRGERGELLLPAVEDVVKEIDIKRGRVVVELLPGLEFRSTNKAQAARRRARRPSASGKAACG